MVEHKVPRKDRDDLKIGIAIVAEACLLDPSEEAEGVVRVARAAEDAEHEGLVEVGDEIPNGVLEAGRPWSLGHHVAYRLVELLRFSAHRPDWLLRLLIRISGALGRGFGREAMDTEEKRRERIRVSRVQRLEES